MVVTEARSIEPTDTDSSPSDAPIYYTVGAHLALAVAGAAVMIAMTDINLREQLLIPFLVAGIVAYTGLALAGTVVAGKRWAARAMDRWRHRTVSLPEFPPCAATRDWSTF